MKLQRLISQDKEFVWGGEQQEAFENFKLAITKTTFMRRFDSTKPFYIDCDALIVGRGTPVHHRGTHNKEYPVAFASGTLRPNEGK